ncbi:MAG: aldehyde dehydrogenase family protein [Rhodothermales bacterium]
MSQSRTEPMGLLIGGIWHQREETIAVVNSFAGEEVGRISRGTPADSDAAVAAASVALKVPFPMHARYDVLMRAADLLVEHQADYALDIAREGSKTIREARREPVRAAGILRLAAEEGRRLHGETLPFDIRPGSERRVGYYYRVPVGVIAAIMPFNDPLAVMTHKIGPAIAGGNAVVLKPDSRAPLAVLRLARDLMDAGLPAGRLNVVTGDGEDAGQALVTDPRVRMITFTGGAKTGERIARSAGVKKLALELGANSPVLVLADADLEKAAAAVADGAFAQAGQNCLGVQRVLVHRTVFDDFSGRLAARASRLRVGASLDEGTDVCPLITERQAARVAEWIAEAQAGGARTLAGGRRDGAMITPTVLADVPAGCRLDCDEIYGPVVALYPFDTLDDAIEQANRTVFGLHAAVFTENLRDAFAAVEGLEAGGVIVNDSTDYRLDVMPFGGTKQSGVGREGLRFALEEMTETKVVCLNL